MPNVQRRDRWEREPVFFHVTSSLNRQSIQEHGLDWALMGAARGIAGSSSPEQEGCFLCRNEGESDWFVRMNNTRGPVDVWAVVGVDESEFVESPKGFLFIERPIGPHDLRLVREDMPPPPRN